MYLGLLTRSARLGSQALTARSVGLKRHFAAFTAHGEALTVPALAASFPYVWLRDNCQCPACVHPTTRQKLHRSSDIPLGARPAQGGGVRAKHDPDGLHIEWAPAGGLDAHQSFYPTAFLAQHASPAALAAFHRDAAPEPWAGERLAALVDSELSFPYATIAEPSSLLRALTLLSRYGILFIRDVPTAETSNERCELRALAGKLSAIRWTFYGDTWDVRNVRNSRNIAYTNLDLGLHMDMMYLQHPPRYQVLHCLRNRASGGRSVFVDGLAAALQLHRNAPTDFAELAARPVHFHYINDNHHLYSVRTTIELDDITSSPASPAAAAPAIRCLNYSPPFQAPLPLDTPPSFSVALARFAGELAAPAARYECFLREGDAVVFDNRRLLHARKAFVDRPEEVPEGETSRWLKGCYLDEDVLWDRRRVLGAQLG